VLLRAKAGSAPPLPDCNDRGEGEGYLALPEVGNCPHTTPSQANMYRKSYLPPANFYSSFISQEKSFRLRNNSIEASEIIIHLDLFKKSINPTHITVKKTNCVQSLVNVDILAQTHKKR
jgi:hypothetical protein